ncbi:tetratricopeptide repeat protein 37-like [Amphibalanus amphitrite]|uniref:tetratricopeptide repeat protein 37-like n=1 Tax=Amphibalanus amphitrite TaxID=1232801 RepID=UPI001C9061E6|nr:tetratricopeptide repeat protein 37-like [Amphibalanus amphitrite]XP_043218879.1 tetratricopeptide repeat protein 37-like [Amphibalanus amphitrite]
MDKHTKALLKSAKELIKGKDHGGALEKCKEVLAGDKNNYMALVFSGACYQELGDAEKTVEAFQAATKVSPELPLAWQGLGSFYEKSGSTKHQESLTEIYMRLLNLLSSDKAKTAEICSKLSWILVHADKYDECIDILYQWKDASGSNFDPSRITSILKEKTVSDSQADRVSKLLSPLITEDASSKNKEFIAFRVQLLHQLKDWKEMQECAQHMCTLFPDSVVAIEWLLRVFVLSDENVSDLEDRLAFMNAQEPDNVWARACRGKLLAQSGDWLAALGQLVPAALGAAGETAAVLALRGGIELLVHGYPAAERTLREALRRSSAAASGRLRLQLAEALVRQGADRAAEAEALLAEAAGSPERDALLAEARLRRGALTEVEAVTAPLEVRAAWLVAERRADEAVALLDGTGEHSPRRLRQLAAALWAAGRREESAARFLEAAKLDPNHPEPFYYLGQYYQERSDQTRALRCYQKACRLNPGEPRCSAALSDLYRARGEHEQNVRLLTAVTESRPDASVSRWAWFRLGLHHLQAGEPQRAVVCLQTAVKAAPDDAVALECLGDAYRLRGAYTSAVQAYSRSAALSEQPVYAQLQMADIRQLLGQLDEAEAGYQQTLAARPGFVPALKGLGETHLRRAQQLVSRQLHGLARDSCQLAADTLTAAVLDQSRLSCLWKQLGDVLCMTAGLPPRYRRLQVAAQLLPCPPADGGACGPLAGPLLVDVAIRCYSQAVAIENLGGLWHDLALSYRLRAGLYAAGESEQAAVALRRALQCAHKATGLLPGDAAIWNTLGVIACERPVEDRRLAQHAFIKSLRLRETAMGWTNLACLYMVNGQLKLANEALTKAQSVEPAYGAAWTGQALIAEQLSPEQATDLFRHAVHLQPLAPAALGYGRWVCRALRDPSVWHTAQYRFNIERMQAVTVAGEALELYTTGAPDDAAGWNMLGLLAERQGRHGAALHAYQRAAELLAGADEPDWAAVDAARTNSARLLTAAGRYDEAVAEYRRLHEASFHSQCGLALALQRAGHDEEAYSAYEAALHWLSPDDANKSHTLVAVAQLLYRFDRVSEARTELLKSFQLEPASEQGLLALTALALRQGDSALALACESELAQRRTQPELAAERALLEACLRLARDDSTGAVRAVQAAVHRHPQQGGLWRLLAAALLQLRPAAGAAVTAATAARRVAAAGAERDQAVLDLVCQAQLQAGDVSGALRSAQRAVLWRPDSPSAWCDLVAARLAGLQWAPADGRGAALCWLRAAVSRLRRGHRLARPLHGWLSTVDRRVEMLLAQG